MTGRPQKVGGTIQSVDRALDILETLAEHQEGMGITELSQKLGLHSSTCHHLVHTLLKRNYLDQSPLTKRYTLGVKLLQLKNIKIEQTDLYSQSLPFLDALNLKTGEAVHLALFQGGELLTIAKLESRYPVKVDNGYVGKSNAAHCTATGKAIIADLSEKELDDLFSEKELKAFTPKTITSLGELKKELARVRRQGYALDDEEYQPGICCVGAPIWDFSSKVVAALSVSIPTMRANPSRMNELIGFVKEAAWQISSRLGYQGPREVSQSVRHAGV